MAKKAYYIVKIKNTPKHIKYRYSATYNGKEEVQEMALECVTEIEGEHVAFKEIFRIKKDDFNSTHSTIKEHIELFTQILELKPKELVVA